MAQQARCSNCGDPVSSPGLCGKCERATDKLISDLKKKK